MILTVGLTGAIASGKSTVARFLGESGCAVIDADEIVRVLYGPGERGYAALLREYGTTILDERGEIDRSRLSDLALSTAEGAEKLNSLIHPLVIDREREWTSALETGGFEGIAVVEATLLLEAGGRERYDRIVVVEAPPQIQIARAIARGSTREETERRIARQMGPAQRRALADYVIRNDNDLAALRAATNRVYQFLLQDLENKGTRFTAPPF
ncbi:MAG TPA: dephospho-CoA kinase [Thermoanaerobaculia bacterium]|nr:dephospho-CoA kinase [Thermoanaerobaculia bacterium]